MKSYELEMRKLPYPFVKSTDTETGIQTTERATCIAVGRVCAMNACNATLNHFIIRQSAVGLYAYSLPTLRF